MSFYSLFRLQLEATFIPQDATDMAAVSPLRTSHLQAFISVVTTELPSAMSSSLSSATPEACLLCCHSPTLPLSPNPGEREAQVVLPLL